MEKRDLVDENRIFTGETIFKNEKIPRERYINVVLVFIQNSEGKFLTQKRSQRKNGKFASTGGHPKSGESSLEGILTEVQEEIGLTLNPNDLKLYYTGRSDEEQVFWDDYYIKMDIPDIKKLKLQTEEVDFVSWLTEDEIHKLNNEDKYFKNDYEEFIRLLDWLHKNSIE